MGVKAFIDTNVFIYLYSEAEYMKQQTAQKAVSTYECVISTQVLNEFSNVCIRRWNKKTDEVESAVDEIAEHCIVVTLEKKDIKQAIRLHKKFGYNYYDCLMIASALNSNGDYLLAEDLADGQIIEGKLTIVNIFRMKTLKSIYNHSAI